MKKLILSICFIPLAFFSSQAQLRIGPQVGVNFSNLTGDVSDTKVLVGLHAGIKAQIPVYNKLSIQPEIMYSGQGAEFDSPGDAKIDYHYVNVPVFLNYQTPVGLFLETGPQVGFLIDANAEANDVEIDIMDDSEKVDFSWDFGVGYQSSLNWGITGRYNLGLTNLQKNGGDVKHSVFQVGVFYLFNARNTKQ
jgi:hypothetical protein